MQKPAIGDDGLKTLNIDTPLYLRQETIVEPLFCRWWAWPHLLSPAQAALNVAFRYLPLLQSFVLRPAIHISATQDLRMFGGPFVHLSSADVPMVKALIVATQTRLHRLLTLAADLKEFNLLLQRSAVGDSLNTTYASLPPSLAGMVELMYDIDNHPKVHLLEELLYAEYGDDLRKGGQQISLSTSNETERRFFMSTPRLESGDAVSIDMEYSDPILDTLSSMKNVPLSLREASKAHPSFDFGVTCRRFLTTEPPKTIASTSVDAGVRVRYFGHACALIQTSATSILIDPTFASRPETIESGSCTRFTTADLPGTIDFVVLTHCHQDHFCPETLLQIRHKIKSIVVPTNNRGSVVDPSMRLSLRELGFSNIVSLSHFDGLSLKEGRLVSIPFPGEHADLEVCSKQSIFVELQGKRLLFLVDSDGRDVALYRRIARRILGESMEIDALFIGMECHGAPLTWLYGPLLSTPLDRSYNESRRLSGSNCAHALQIIQQFRSARVYVYAMGQEPWLRYLMGLAYEPDSIQLTESTELVQRCRGAGMVAERLYGSQDISI
jgi:L-ascorbate metabolism protein UlaG (beta-lactamase superfamily)